MPGLAAKQVGKKEAPVGNLFRFYGEVLGGLQSYLQSCVHPSVTL